MRSPTARSRARCSLRQGQAKPGPSAVPVRRHSNATRPCRHSPLKFPAPTAPRPCLGGSGPSPAPWAASRGSSRTAPWRPHRPALPGSPQPGRAETALRLRHRQRAPRPLRVGAVPERPRPAPRGFPPVTWRCARGCARPRPARRGGRALRGAGLGGQRRERCTPHIEVFVTSSQGQSG